MKIIILPLVFLAIAARSLTITVDPGDNIADSLLTLSLGDTLFLMPGTYMNTSEQPMLTAGPSQSGVTITSNPDNRAVLDGQNIERSVLSLTGPHSSDIIIKNLVITGGNATGTEFFNGGGISASESKAFVSNCLVTGNTALMGGGIGAEGGTLHVQYSTISDNEALVTGGGINLFACDFTGFLNRFLSNTSSDDGGGLNAYQSLIVLSNSLFTDNYSGDDGGAITVLQGTSTFSFLTIYSNEAFDDGGGMRIHTIDSVLVESSIITSNLGKGGISVISPKLPYLSHVCCWDNGLTNYNGMDDPTGTDGNISEDPLFADSDFNLSQTSSGQFVDSPALNSGHALIDQTVVFSLSTRTDRIPDIDFADMGFHHINSDQTGISAGQCGDSVEMVITPSPAAGSVRVTLMPEVPYPVTIQVYDLTGRKLHGVDQATMTNGESWQWNPSNSFPGGLVLFQAVWQGGSVSGRVVVLK